MACDDDWPVSPFYTATPKKKEKLLYSCISPCPVRCLSYFGPQRILKVSTFQLKLILLFENNCKAKF